MIYLDEHISKNEQANMQIDIPSAVFFKESCFGTFIDFLFSLLVLQEVRCLLVFICVQSLTITKDGRV